MTSPARAFHLRNTLTYAGLLLGCAAASAALRGHAAAAGALVALAVIADAYDGRFARLFPADATKPAIGVELDSLCDGCTFGMVPVVCTFAIHPQAGPIAWIAGFFYVTSALTRLAFFNVTHDVIRGFVGIPVPVAALIWSSALCFTSSPWMLAIVLFAGGIGMISPLRVPRPVGPGLLVFAVWPLVVAVSHVIGTHP